MRFSTSRPMPATYITKSLITVQPRQTDEDKSNNVIKTLFKDSKRWRWVVCALCFQVRQVWRVLPDRLGCESACTAAGIRQRDRHMESETGMDSCEVRVNRSQKNQEMLERVERPLTDQHDYSSTTFRLAGTRPTESVPSSRNSMTYKIASNIECSRGNQASICEKNYIKSVIFKWSNSGD